METMVVGILNKELNQVKICRRKADGKLGCFFLMFSEPARGSHRNCVGSFIVFR